MKKLLLNFVALMGVLLFLGTGSAKAWFWGIAGQFNDWNQNAQTNSNDYFLGDQAGTYSNKLNIAQLSGQFKIVKNNGSKIEGYYGWDNKDNIELSQNLKDADFKIYDYDSDNLYLTSPIYNVTATFVLTGQYGDGFSKVTINGSPYPDKLYLIGNVGNTSFGTNGPSATGTNGVYTWENIDIQGGGYFNLATIIGDNFDEVNKGTRYGASTKDEELAQGSNEGSLSTYAAYVSAADCNSWKLPSGLYNITADLKNKKITAVPVAHPDNLYLYGHVKGGDWDATDYYQAENKEGIYTFTDVNISGNEIEENQNYIAFFSYMDTDNDSELDFEAMLPRYGGDITQSGGANNGGTNIVFTEEDFQKSTTIIKNIVRYDQNQSDMGQERNFRLPNGMYDIIVNLNNNTISVTKFVLSYKWHDADGKEISGDTHEMTYGVNNKIQISAKDKLRHEAADNAEFTVEYEPLATVNRGVKAYANVTGNTDYYEKDNDQIITLKKAGNYTITASLPEGLQNDYYGLEPIFLEATVAKAPVTVTAEDFEKNFDPTNNVYQPGISFSQAVEESDFTITIAPANNAEGWVKLSDYQTDGSSVEDAYKLALSDDIFSHQYQQLTAEYIDGFYSPLQTYTLSGEGNNYTVSQEFPCSGIYNMTIQEAENGNITFDEKTVTITIRPNLGVMFGSVSGFNINGYGFTNENSQDIKYATSQATEALLKKSVAYKPGTYFDSSFTITIDGTTYPSTNAVAETQKAQNTDWINFDFSYLVNNDNFTVTANVVKNGASSESFNFLVSKATTTPTAVDSVEAVEEGEAVYYNLQGVKVENPQHGIYVKVVNGKAQKVVL